MHSFARKRDLEDERVRKGTCHQWGREQFGNREARLPWYLQSWPRHSLSQLRSPGRPCPSLEIACHPALQHPLEHPASHGHPVCCTPALPASLSTYRWSKHCISLWWCIENLRSIRLPEKNPTKMLVTTTSMCVYEYEAFWVDVNFKPGTHSLHIKFDHLPVEEGRLAHIGSAHKHNLRECVDRRLQKPLQRALPSSTYMGDLAHLAHHLSPNAQNCFTLSVFSPHFRDKKKHLLVTLLPSFLSSLQSLILSHSTLVHAAISQHLSFSSWSSPATIIYEVVGIECVAIAKPLRWGPIIPCFRTSQELKP